MTEVLKMEPRYAINVGLCAAVLCPLLFTDVLQGSHVEGL